MSWHIRDVGAELDRLSDDLAAAMGAVEEDIAADLEEPDEPEQPRHRRPRLGESSPPNIW